MTNNKGNTKSFESSELIISPVPVAIKDSSNPHDEELENQAKMILEQNHMYFIEYNKLYEANAILRSQLNMLQKEKNGFKHSLMKLESKSKKGADNFEIDDMYTNRRRKRRTKEEIKRTYVCLIDNCNKSYGSEGSLNQHKKIKHKK